MSDNIFPSISTNSDLFFNSETESLYDQLYSNDSKNSYEKDFNNFYFSPFVSLLIGIYEKAKENLQKNNTQPTSKKILEKKLKEEDKVQKKVKKMFMIVLNKII